MGVDECIITSVQRWRMRTANSDQNLINVHENKAELEWYVLRIVFIVVGSVSALGQLLPP